MEIEYPPRLNQIQIQIHSFLSTDENSNIDIGTI